VVDPLKVDPLIEEKVSTETPEDVAVLYNWANLQGAQYRDFSASRREYRAQMHRRAAEQRRKENTERATQLDADAARHEVELREAAQQEATMQASARRAAAVQQEELKRAQEERARAAAAAIAAEAAAAQAAAVYRQQGSRGFEEVRAAEPVREVVQERIEDRRSQEVRPQVEDNFSRASETIRLPGSNYAAAAPVTNQNTGYAPLPSFSARENRGLPGRYKEPVVSRTEPAPQFSAAEYRQTPVVDQRKPTQEVYIPGAGIPMAGIPAVRTPEVIQDRRQEPVVAPVVEAPAYVPTVSEIISETARVAAVERTQNVGRPEARRSYIPSPPIQQFELPAEPTTAPVPMVQPIVETPLYSGYSAPNFSTSTYTPEPREVAPSTHSMPAVPAGQPEWLYSGAVPVAKTPTQTPTQQTRAAAAARRDSGQSPISDTLQYSRERVASRWFALKGIFEQPSAEPEPPPPVRQKETHPPVLALFSLAGGVGKTSMVATLGRTLSSLGEKTLLLDTTSYGLLPFYFGARELRPNTIRTFAPPSGSSDAPINMISMNIDAKPPEPGVPDAMVEEIFRNARGTNRIVMDVTTAAGPLARRILKMAPTVVIPVAPDMSSVISLNAVEQFFKGQTDAEGRPVKVFYLLNQFDPSQALHLDVREVLRQQLGDRLLPFVVRRTPAVSEALAEGMTVMDYAPNSAAAEDYLNFANWLRGISAPVSAGFRGVRWSEQA
jgi:cellulose biosynthesis protein BcsQ